MKHLGYPGDSWPSANPWRQHAAGGVGARPDGPGAEGRSHRKRMASKTVKPRKPQVPVRAYHESIGLEGWAVAGGWLLRVGELLRDGEP